MRNKIIIFIIIVLSIILIPKVKASEVLFGPNASFNIGSAIRIDDTHNSIPYTNSFSSNPLNLGAISLSISPQSSGAESILGSPTFNYLIIEMCTSGTVRLNVSNSSTINSFLVTGGYNGYDLGTTGTVSSNNYTCYNNLYQIPIGKWVLGEYSEWFEVDSYFNFERVSSSGNFFKITKVFLSDEDLLSKYQTQTQLVNKLNDVQSAINSQTNTINNNINNQSTNIQNKIDAAKNQAHQDAQQAHNDAVNTQNTIKDDSVDSPNTSINTIKGSLASNGVITSLVVLPVTLYQSILNSVNGTCNTFSLGSLYGTNLTIPCINVSNYLGTTLWGSIDVIISGIFIYMISRKMVKVFHQLSSLKEGDVLN